MLMAGMVLTFCVKIGSYLNEVVMLPVLYLLAITPTIPPLNIVILSSYLMNCQDIVFVNIRYN